MAKRKKDSPDEPEASPDVLSRVREISEEQASLPKGRNASLPSSLRKPTATAMASEGARVAAELGPIPKAPSTEEIKEFHSLEQLLIPWNGENKDQVFARSEVNDVEQTVYSQAIIMARHWNLPILEEFVFTKLALGISKGRKGRKEFVQAHQAANMSEGAHYAQGISSLFRKD